METSSFSDIQQTYPDAELLPVGGSTCDCYRVKLYGKFHFMKRLKPELRTDPRYVSALQKEFETGYRLDHPHLVRYVSKGQDYLLTEYVDGENLKEFSESHPDYFKSRKKADRFLSQLLDVVGYLHQHQIVHLDLKPENILITRVGHELILTDLGYCYTDTYTDTMGRTDKYAAPEQLDGSAKVDARTDIYAIGKILLALPCSNIYNKVIARCTAESPSDRYQTIEELQNALKPNHALSRIFLLIVALGLITSFLIYIYRQQPADTIIITPDSVSEQPVDTLAPSSEQNMTAHSRPPQTIAPTMLSPVTMEQSPNQETIHCELSDAEKTEIRKTTLSIIRPVYQRKIEPIIDRIIRGESDADSLDSVYVVANEDVFAALRAKRLESKYPDVSEEDVNREIFNAIGEVMHYYTQTVLHHFNPGTKLPLNPFAD